MATVFESSEPKHVLPAFGVPYAKSGFDDDGYYVECPVCGERNRARVSARSEDGVTKGAARKYAQHFESRAKEEA